MMLTADNTRRLTTVLGGSIESHEAGDGPVLIMMHGGGPGANAWDNSEHLIEQLAERFTVILLNLSGYGGSEQIEPFPSEFDDEFNARVIRTFMEVRGIASAHLYGASGSGAPAVRLAIDSPQMVQKLVLKGPGGLPSVFTPDPPPGLQALIAYLQEPTRDRMAEAMDMFVPNSAPDQAQKVDRRHAAAQRTPRYQPAPYRELSPMLRDITQPTLVLWGHHDNMVPFEGALTALKHIPDVRVHIWGGGVGHFVEWERPQETTRLLIDFLTGSGR